jgi:hypothetical protein
MVDARDNFWEIRTRMMLEHEHNVSRLTDAQVSDLQVKILELRGISSEMDTWIDETTQAERTPRGRIIALLDAWSIESFFNPEHEYFTPEVQEFRELVARYVTASTSTSKDRFPSAQAKRYIDYARQVDRLSPQQVEKAMSALAVLEQTLERYTQKQEGINIQEINVLQKINVLHQYIQKKDIDNKEKLITVLVFLDESNDDMKHPVFEHFIFNDAVRALDEAGLLVKQKPQSASVIEAQKAKDTHAELLAREEEILWEIEARVGALGEAQVDDALKAADALGKQAELLIQDDLLGMDSLLETINRGGVSNKTKLINILCELEFIRLPNLRKAPDSKLKDAFFSKNNDFQWYTGSQMALTPQAVQKAELEALNTALWDDTILNLEEAINIQEDARDKLDDKIEYLNVYLVELKGNTAIASTLVNMAEEKEKYVLEIAEINERIDGLRADLHHYQALAADEPSRLFDEAADLEEGALPGRLKSDEDAFFYLDMIKAQTQNYINHIKKQEYDGAPLFCDMHALEGLVEAINQGNLDDILRQIEKVTLPALKQELFRDFPEQGTLEQLRGVLRDIEGFQAHMVSAASQPEKSAPVRQRQPKADDSLDALIDERVAEMSDVEIVQACEKFNTLQAQAELLRDRTQHVTSKLFSTSVDKEAKSVHENMNQLLRIIQHNKPDLKHDSKEKLREKVGTVLLHLEGAKTLTWLNQDKTLDALSTRFKRVDMLLTPFVAAVNAFRWCFNFEPIQSPISVESFKADLLQLKKDVDAGHEDEEDLDKFSKQ